MIKEICLVDGLPSFVFVGRDPYECLDKVMIFFESNYEFSSKEYVSGWHSTVYEYKTNELNFCIGDESDVLSLTLKAPITKSSMEKVKELVQAMDSFLSS